VNSPTTPITRRSGSALGLAVGLVVGANAVDAFCSATVTVRVTRGSRAVRMRTATFQKYGRKNLDLARLTRGSYRIVVIAQSGGQTSVDRATLVVR